MTGAAELARRTASGCTPTWPRPSTRKSSASAEFGCTPAEYADSSAGSARTSGSRHGIHLDADAIKAIRRNRHRCRALPDAPTRRIGAGIAPVRDLLDAGVAVGLGADGAASNESGGLGEELHQALLLARLRGGPTRPDRARSAVDGARWAAPAASAGGRARAR